MAVVGSCCVKHGIGNVGNMQNDFGFDYGNGYQKRFDSVCLV